MPSRQGSKSTGSVITVAAAGVFAPARLSALLGGMKHYNVPKQDKVKFSHHTGYVENESMDSVVGLRTQEILENRVSPAVHYIPQSGLNKEVLVVGGAPQWVPSPTALSPS